MPARRRGFEGCDSEPTLKTSPIFCLIEINYVNHFLHKVLLVA
jgi:hypothetical protein